MKERPIIFNGEMVRAILDGRKTQTRRIMKPQPTPCTLEKGGHWWPSNVFKTMLHIEEEMQNGKGGWGGLVGDACPFGDIGDRIWVRETFQGPLIPEDELSGFLGENPDKFESPAYCEYAADGGPRPEYIDADDNTRHGWRPAIHMPRWASRILLEITDVRVERLNTISEEDAKAEGAPTECCVIGDKHFLGFRSMWKSIYGDESWQANPWVWVIEFKRIDGGAA
ncbi:hypothetical protein SM108_004056 [Cronobacter sakazakii]|nr:hypothetical protein [Cronobacter sakazakii]